MLDARRFIPDLDREALREFCMSSWPDSAQAINPFDMLEWQYEHNPHSKDYSHYVITDRGAIIGQLGSIPVEMLVQGEPLSTCWLVSFMVRPEYRDRFVGGLLLRKALEEHPLPLVLGMTNDVATMYRRLGWTDLGESRFWWRILRWRPFLESYPRFRPVARVMSPLAGLGGSTLGIRSHFGNGSEVTVDPSTRFDDGFNRFGLDVAGDYPVIAARSAALSKLAVRGQAWHRL